MYKPVDDETDTETGHEENEESSKSALKPANPKNKFRKLIRDTLLLRMELVAWFRVGYYLLNVLLGYTQFTIFVIQAKAKFYNINNISNPDATLGVLYFLLAAKMVLGIVELCNFIVLHYKEKDLFKQGREFKPSIAKVICLKMLWIFVHLLYVLTVVGFVRCTLFLRFANDGYCSTFPAGFLVGIGGTFSVLAASHQVMHEFEMQKHAHKAHGDNPDEKVTEEV